MPRYDYRCLHCGVAWEESFPINDRDTPCETECPECGKNTVERYLPSAPGVCYNAGGNSLAKKTPDSFKDVLRNIKSKHYGSRMNIP
jgi:putative FmdB family regulatory protein